MKKGGHPGPVLGGSALVNTRQYLGGTADEAYHISTDRATWPLSRRF
jgi:hypothetical protein